MNLTFATKAVLEELTRMRLDGIEKVYIQDETLSCLKQHFDTEDQEEVSDEENPEIGLSKKLKSVSTLSVEESSSPTKRKELPSNTPEDSCRLPQSPVFQLPEGTKESRWEWLREKVLECETCNAELNPNGKVVFGEGNLNADIFLCGEAPGAEEEIAGSPFVGPAGELLMKILSAMGLQREQVYIGNIVNWRPRHNLAYGNRPPSREEIDFCLPYLKGQLQIIEPKIVVALGKTATDGLMGHDPKRRLSHVRGNWHEVMGYPMMVTYHPSYLLHNPSKNSKRKVWEDFLLIMEKLGMTITEKQRGFFL